jgi:hypothetical protein
MPNRCLILKALLPVLNFTFLSMFEKKLRMNIFVSMRGLRSIFRFTKDRNIFFTRYSENGRLVKKVIFFFVSFKGINLHLIAIPKLTFHVLKTYKDKIFVSLFVLRPIFRLSMDQNICPALVSTLSFGWFRSTVQCQHYSFYAEVHVWWLLSLCQRLTLNLKVNTVIVVRFT